MLPRLCYGVTINEIFSFINDNLFNNLFENDTLTNFVSKKDLKINQTTMFRELCHDVVINEIFSFVNDDLFNGLFESDALTDFVGKRELTIKPHHKELFTAYGNMKNLSLHLV